VNVERRLDSGCGRAAGAGSGGARRVSALAVELPGAGLEGADHARDRLVEQQPDQLLQHSWFRGQVLWFRGQVLVPGSGLAFKHFGLRVRLQAARRALVVGSGTGSPLARQAAIQPGWRRRSHGPLPPGSRRRPSTPADRARPRSSPRRRPPEYLEQVLHGASGGFASRQDVVRRVPGGGLRAGRARKCRMCRIDPPVSPPDFDQAVDRVSDRRASEIHGRLNSS
jgi:hypothetical protein